MDPAGTVAAGLALTATLTGCGEATPPAAGGDLAAARPQNQTQAAPRRILVTNDDGWSAPGIVALREALRRAGHTVVEVAPADDQSGTGAALTLKGTLPVVRPSADQDVWLVGGRPADAAAVGLRSVMAAAPPDLVVSGINSGTTSASRPSTPGPWAPR